MPFRSKNTASLEPTGTLPAGHADPDSEWWIAPEHREHYRVDDDDLAEALTSTAPSIVELRRSVMLARHRSDWEAGRERSRRMSGPSIGGSIYQAPMTYATAQDLLTVRLDRDDVERAVHYLRRDRAVAAVEEETRAAAAAAAYEQTHRCRDCGDVGDDVVLCRPPGLEVRVVVGLGHEWKRVGPDAAPYHLACLWARFGRELLDAARPVDATAR